MYSVSLIPISAAWTVEMKNYSRNEASHLYDVSVETNQVAESNASLFFL